MFKPSHCPWTGCRFHSAPQPGWFQSWGSYQPRCRRAPVPRFRCGSCQRTFSRQTFHHSYREHKPELNPVLLRGLLAGRSQREMARRLPITRRNLALKLARIEATLAAGGGDHAARFAGTACVRRRKPARPVSARAAPSARRGRPAGRSLRRRA